MIPKRKLIRKQFVAPETTHHEETNLCEGDLIQQLKSTDQRAKTDAIAAIANLQLISDQLQEELYSTTTLAELMKILITTSNYSLTQTTLFALNNLCLRETENNPIDKTVNTLFNIGLDKALLQLDSSNANLIKPILVFMANIAEFVPSQYQYLLLGIQSTLINGCQKYLKQSPYYDLVLEFLMKSNAQIAIEQKEDQTYNIEKITPEQLHCIKLLQQIAQINKMYKNRAMATKILLVMTKGKAKQCVQLFCTNFEQLITDIDLEREYLANFHNKQVEQQLQDDEEIEQIQKEQNIMQQQKKQKNKGKNKEIIPKQQEQTSHSMFIDGVQAIQILLQFIVQQFEDEDNFDEEEVDEQQMEEKGQIQQELDVGFSNAIFLPYIKGCLVKSICQFQKYAKLSFIEGQNIIELILRTILSLPSDIITNTKQENKINVLGLAQLTESIIVNQFKYEMSNPNQIPKQNFIFNFKTCLQIILKLKTISNRSLYIELPFLKYEVENSKSHDGRVIAINNQWKQCWIALLEIFSMFYNPQKTQSVTQNQNRSIGAILRQLIIQIPQIQLEQWRAQAIDTLFDVYSNENFDKIFMDNGFVDILNQVLKVAGSSNKMGQKKSKKSNNFISAVVTDIQRFISYKKKMIGF